MSTPPIFNVPAAASQPRLRKRRHDADSLPQAKEANTAAEAPVIPRLMSVVQSAMPKAAPQPPLSSKWLVQAYASKNDESDGENGDQSEEGSDDDIRIVNRAFANTLII